MQRGTHYLGKHTALEGESIFWGYKNVNSPSTKPHLAKKKISLVEREKSVLDHWLPYNENDLIRSAVDFGSSGSCYSGNKPIH